MDRSGNHHAIVRGRIDIILHVVGAHQIDVVPSFRSMHVMRSAMSAVWPSIV
ncbi:MAG: hypothetical protein ACE5G3_06160 [Gammaproteobacteria bacterium]